jgi:uncharacterized repeat protein (TIGR03803 family)
MLAVCIAAMRKKSVHVLLSLLLVIVLRGTAEAQIFQLNTLAHFDGTNGAAPNSELVLANDGKFYGTTTLGGQYDSGVLFQMSSTGTVSAMVVFDSTNGANPNAALAVGQDGLLYGSTFNGGTNINGGTLFQFNTNGTLTTLANFNGVSSTDGKRPRAALTADADGAFYGSTYQGGSGYGVLFRFYTNGDVVTLTNFSNTNGAFPRVALTWGNDGQLYGVTSLGGTYNLGTAFCLATNGALQTLVMFNGTNGAVPNAALTLGNDGLLYGLTSQGGAYNLGTVFSLATNGALTTLVNFRGPNGAAPNSALALGNDGYFYGMTTQGGNTNLNGGLGLGTVFRFSTNGSLATLIKFDSTNGALPYGKLIEGPDGDYYGTTSQGGTFDLGTVFKLTALPFPPLNISLISNAVVLEWTNSAFQLQSAPEVDGGFTNILAATSPHTNPITAGHQFFRLSDE